nr:alpha/beta fold hydrolase [Caulobacter sp. UNC358MFTsu5.1]
MGWVLAFSIAQPARAQLIKPNDRQEAVEVIRELRRIATPNGVDRSETLSIGGVDQFVSIRGRDRRNPILLVLHGGPGFPETPLAWWNTRDLEEYFIVVHWDQRGSGKTHLLNDARAVAPTMRPERFIADTEELTAWLRRELGKDKIFLLGHSWGSYIGLSFAQRRPEWLYAYIGVGQAANSPESERRGYAATREAALRAGDKRAVEELDAIAPYARPDELFLWPTSRSSGAGPTISAASWPTASGKPTASRRDYRPTTPTPNPPASMTETATRRRICSAPFWGSTLAMSIVWTVPSSCWKGDTIER